ncbi:MAG: hypothetical protein ACLP2Y_11970 [Limisphaerales bacterium]
MPNIKLYKIEVIKNIPLPIEKVTGISWDDLVEVIAKNGIGIAKNIRFHNVGQPHGTDHITGAEMLSLWKTVESKKQIKPLSAPSSC